MRADDGFAFLELLPFHPGLILQLPSLFRFHGGPPFSRRSEWRDIRFAALVLDFRGAANLIRDLQLWWPSGSPRFGREVKHIKSEGLAAELNNNRIEAHTYRMSHNQINPA